MKFISNYKAAIIACILVLIVVLIRISGWNYFSENTGDLLTKISERPSFVNLSENKNNLPVVDISSALMFAQNPTKNVINVPYDKLLSKDGRKLLAKNKKGLILCSDDKISLVRAWALLNQMGYKDIFLAGPGIETDEELRYQFQPDTGISIR